MYFCNSEAVLRTDADAPAAPLEVTYKTNEGLRKLHTVPRRGSLTLKSIATSNQSDFQTFGHIEHAHIDKFC